MLWALCLAVSAYICYADPGSRKGWPTYGQNAQRHWQSAGVVNVSGGAVSLSNFTIGSVDDAIPDCAGFAPAPLVTPAGLMYVLVADKQGGGWCDYTLVSYDPVKHAVLGSFKSSTGAFPPAVARDGTVYVLFESFLVALSPNLTESWRVRLDKNPLADIFGMNVLLSNDDSTAYIYVSDVTPKLIAVNLGSKAIAWQAKVADGQPAATQLQVALSAGGNTLLIVWQDTTNYYNTLLAFDAATGKSKWSHSCSAVYTSSNVAAGCASGSGDDGAVYWWCGESGILAHNATDGTVLWSAANFNYMDNIAVSCSTGQLVGASASGSMLVIDLASGAVNGQYAWPTGILYPTLVGLDANNTAFFVNLDIDTNDRTLLALSIETGALLVQQYLDSDPSARATIGAFADQGSIFLRSTVKYSAPAVYVSVA